ncbi:MAG: GntR family transcriptional regulator [Actinomycetota bacterium]|nr:GntR family transcriptional regulator [Actinomycetota bacterium]
MTLLRDDARPLYVRASERLRRLIAEGEFADGDRLPPESELAAMLGVSRSTVREGLRELELGGIVERVHGRGTTVRTSRVVSGLNRLESLESLAATQGWRCGTVGTAIVDLPIPKLVAAALELAEGDPGVRLSRVKTRNRTPICEMVSWLPARDMSAAGLRRAFETSITELLAGATHLARAAVSAASASAEEAAKLAVPAGFPLVVLFETFLDERERPICWSRNVFVPDAISLEVLRHPAGA